MLGLDLSPDNKFAAAYTNNNQTILLNTLIGEFHIVDNPLGPGETVVGLNLLDMDLTIYGQYTWVRFDLRYEVSWLIPAQSRVPHYRWPSGDFDLR